MKNLISKFEPLAWAFFIAGIIYGLGFVLTAYTGFVTKSSLYDALEGVWTYLPEAWGITSIVAVVLSVLAARLDWKPLGVVGSVLAIGTWLYAVGIYFQTGYYIVGLSVASLYLSFWVYFYFKYISKVTKYR